MVLNSVFREDLAEKVTPNQGQKEELEEHSRPREGAPHSKTLNSPGGVGSVELPKAPKWYYSSAEHTASAK